MAALCEANEERPGSRDHASDSHVQHRRAQCTGLHTNMHTQRYTHLLIPTLQCREKLD